MEKNRHFDVQVNWTKFFDTSVLVAGFISFGSIPVSLLL